MKVATLEPGRWLDGKLPESAVLGIDTIVRGDLAFKRFHSKQILRSPLDNIARWMAFILPSVKMPASRLVITVVSPTRFCLRTGIANRQLRRHRLERDDCRHGFSSHLASATHCGRSCMFAVGQRSEPSTHRRESVIIEDDVWIGRARRFSKACASGRDHSSNRARWSRATCRRARAWRAIRASHRKRMNADAANRPVSESGSVIRSNLERADTLRLTEPRSNRTLPWMVQRNNSRKRFGG